MADTPPFSRTMEFTYGEPREVAPGVWRIVANNPTPFTFKGTNTYLIGALDETGQAADHGALTVIDPGPDDPVHLQAIREAAKGRTIERIVLTHTHRDHCDGLPALKAATGASTAGYGWPDLAATRARAEAAGQTSYFDFAFTPDRRLADGDWIDGEFGRLQAIHTPGHAPDHFCFALEQRGVFFSGDHVMGWNTSVVAPPMGNMNAYMQSLERLLKRDETMFLPGHGGAVRSPARVVKAFIVHRKWRESAILDCIREDVATVSAITARIYPELDPALISAAKLSVVAHVERLIETGAVSCGGSSVASGVLSASKPASA